MPPGHRLPVAVHIAINAGLFLLAKPRVALIPAPGVGHDNAERGAAGWVGPVGRDNPGYLIGPHSNSPGSGWPPGVSAQSGRPQPARWL